LREFVDVPTASRTDYSDKGHVVVRGLADQSVVDTLRPEVERLVQETAWDKRPIAERDTYGKAFLQAPNLWRQSELVAAFTLAPRFAKVAADLMGVEGVRLYHDQALLKEGLGGRTPWHQDHYYWPLDTDRTITMWMPLVDLPTDVGSMTFVDGSHLLGDLGGCAISDESDAEFAQLIDRTDLQTSTHGSMSAGDATFHAGWTLHCAEPNPTNLLRTVMTVIYFADGTRVSDPVANDNQEFDRKSWLGETAPGALIEHDLNARAWPLGA
jgi:ectoine hydroxylase-related dioxygenase (phytanoyl-CoA dioxygenase family)